jgi:hypothetical protein
MDAITDVHPSVVRASEPIDYLQKQFATIKNITIAFRGFGFTK